MHFLETLSFLHSVYVIINDDRAVETTLMKQFCGRKVLFMKYYLATE